MSKANINKLKLNLTLIASLLINLISWFSITGEAQAWSANSLDSASGINYCTSCHTQKSGTLTITKLNGATPQKNLLVVPAGGSFTMEFNTKGFGYNRFAVAGAIRVPETNSGGNDKWTAGIGPAWNQNTKTGQTLWTIAAQATTAEAPAQSPYMLVTNFASAAPLSKQGVTKDDGGASDLNALAHEETFTVTINVDGTVTPGTYTLYVQGVGSDSGSRLAYNEQALTVVVSGDATPPTAPTGLAVVPNGGDGSKLNINWVAPADGDVAGYLLYRSTDDVTFQEIARVSGIATVNYADANLKQSTTYYYKVAAIDTSENISAQSTSANGTTSAAARVDTTPPPKTTDLAARAGVNKVDLSWSASTHGDIQEYRIYRGTSPGTFDFAAALATVAGNVYTYSDNTALNGQYYYYAIKAVDVASNISVKSNEVSAIPAPDFGAVQPHGSYSTNENLCYLCHNSHTALGDALLTKSLMSEVCYTCHDGTQSTYNVMDQFNITTNPSHHKVPEGRLDCADCHDPHANPTTTPRILKAIRTSAAVPMYNPDMYGFILNWLVAGTWDSNPDGTLTNTQWISESAVAPIAGENAAGAINWKAYNSTNANTNGYVDLTNASAFGAVTQKEAYALTYIYSSYTRKTHLHVGSDDGIKVYLNGLLIHTNNQVRNYQVDEDMEYNVTMFKGWNRLLLKISQDGDSSWGFGVRFFDHVKNKPMTDFGVDLAGYRGQSVKTGASGNNYCWVCHGSDSILGDPYGNHQTYFNTAYNEHNVSAKMPNPASGTGIKCINCHQNHGSAYAPLLKGTDDQSFCINCHISAANPAVNFTSTKAYPYTDGTLPTIPNSSNYFVGSQHEIAFAGRNGCIMCHDPHGTALDSSGYHKMLDATFPLSRVTGGNGTTASHTTAEICFKCHDIRYYFNATGNPTVGSKFGNGNGRNLHWHVADYNLSCRTCHDPHESMNQQWHNATISGRSGGTLNNPELINFDWSIANNSVTGSSGYSNKVGFVSTAGQTHLNTLPIAVCEVLIKLLFSTQEKINDQLGIYGLANQVWIIYTIAQKRV